MKKKQLTERPQEEQSAECGQARFEMPEEGGSLRSRPLYALQILVVTHAILRERM